MRATKADLELELAHYKRQNFYLTTFIAMVWAVSLGVLVAYQYKMHTINEARADKYVEESLGGWHTEVIPEPQTMTPLPDPYILAPTKWIDILFQSVSPITSANAAVPPSNADIPPSKFPFASPLKLWSIEQLASDRDHLACSATRSMPSGVVVSVTAYKTGTTELVIDRASFMMSEEKPYLDAVISVDGMVFVQTVAKRLTEFSTSLDLSSLPLTQLANGKILRVTINGFYLEFDLTGSANAAKYVNACNTTGQIKVWERRVQAAAPAVVLETTP